ncbi:XdhC family protein [Modicisalibacter coralii]|uniref:XdhC family protein n=1 Tax=Modicisalibacter coralii TaxID=2304602 RepID=UPI00100AFC1F|nr:XdhC family protein [Halomonas coralii]
MHDMDYRVLHQARDWAGDGHTIWLCTVISTYGSSPRPPGALLVARGDGTHLGSLSGGCVEEAFLDQLAAGEFSAPATVQRYGETPAASERLALPCGGVLEVLVERRPATPDWLDHLAALCDALAGQRRRVRRVSLGDGGFADRPLEVDGPAVEHRDDAVTMRIGPVVRLIVAGISPVAEACARFAHELGHEVVVCDPREAACRTFAVEGVRVEPVLPASFIAAGGCHGATAVVALTHDPRLDDLTILEAVRTAAFYVGVMGSRRTSDARATRLMRSGGLGPEELARIHMPIGLDLGSRTPAEIGLAVVADILRVYHGRDRHAL